MVREMKGRPSHFPEPDVKSRFYVSSVCVGFGIYRRKKTGSRRWTLFKEDLDAEDLKARRAPVQGPTLGRKRDRTISVSF